MSTGRAKTMTTTGGAPIADNQNSITAGPRGPALLQDDHRVGNDDYTQAGNLFRLFTAEQRERLFQNIADAMSGVPETIVQRQLAHFSKADSAYGAGVANALIHRVKRKTAVEV